MLFVDSADKAARFIWCCDAFNIPLVFLADVPGFMIGTAGRARRASSATAPRWSPPCPRRPCPRSRVIVRKAYGAGLYAMSGPAFEPEATIALPTAKIAVMGPEAAVNAVFANKIAAIEDPDERDAFVAEQRRDLRGGRRPAAAGVGAGDRRRGRVRATCATSSSAGSRCAGGQGPALLRPPPRRAAGLRASPMPWCEDCARFWNPNTLPPDGTCPTLRPTRSPTRRSRRRCRGTSGCCCWPLGSTSASGPSRASLAHQPLIGR